MTAKELFVTALRVIGVLQLIRAFGYALEAFDIWAKYYRPFGDTVGNCFTHTVFYSVLGVYLVLGAPAFVRALFTDASDRESGDTKDQADKRPDV